MMNARKPKGFSYSKRFLTLFLLLFSLTFLGFADTYYVKPTGNNANTGLGTGDGEAWETITKANNTLTAGDTVEIMAGIYSTSDGGRVIYPDNDGASGNPITYTNYSTDLVYIRGQAIGALISKNYITIDGLRFEEASQAAAVMYRGIEIANDKHHIIIQNCVIKNTVETRGGSAIQGIKINDGVEYCQILDNEISYIGSTAVGESPGDGIKFQESFDDPDWVCTSQYNLVEGNTFGRCSHDPLAVNGFYNVIRGNTFANPWHRGMSCYSDYNDGETKQYNVIEDNIFANNGDSRKYAWYNQAIATRDIGNIFRRNRIYGSLGVGLMFSTTSPVMDQRYAKVYHNIMYDNGQQGTGSGYDRGISMKEDAEDMQDSNVFKNNIIYANHTAGVGYMEYAEAGDHTFANNWWDADGDPDFTDPDNGDFTISGSSPCVGAGAWLTTITSASDTDTSFVVDDASYFCDGHGITTGDEIQLEGDTAAVGITDINYGTNTITVDEAVTWTIGDGVGLEFEGSNPDIGWYEYVPLGGGTDQEDWPNIYLDADAGDSGDGSQADPYNEYSDINWTTGGDNSVFDWYAGVETSSVTVNFQDGDTWRSDGWVVGHSGSAAYPIIFKSYGSGDKPKILGSTVKNNTTDWSRDIGTEFSDDFDDNDWTTDPTWDDVTAAGGAVNQNGRLEVVVDNSGGAGGDYILEDVTARDEYYCSFRYYFVSFGTFTNGMSMVGSGLNDMLKLGVLSDAGTPKWRFEYKDDAGTQIVGGNAVSTGQWYSCVLYTKAATGVGNDDGIAQVWIDGTLVYDNQAVDNDTKTNDDVRAGNSYASNGAVLTFYVDDFDCGTTRTDANVWYAASTTAIGSLIMDSEATVATMVAAKTNLNVQAEAWHDSPNNRIYLYSTTNPATAYSGDIECAKRAHVIVITDKSYITIEDLEIKYTAWDAIRVTKTATCTDIIVQNVTTSYTGGTNSDTEGAGTGVFINLADNCTVQDCTMTKFWRGVCIYSTDTNSMMFTIYNNAINTALTSGGDHAIAIAGTGMTDFTGSTISYNTIHHFYGRGVALSHSQNVSVTNNTIYTNIDQDGMDEYGIEMGTTNSTGHSVLRNLIYDIQGDPESWGGGCGITTRAAESSTIAYNIIYGCQKGVIVSDLTVDGGNDNNEFYNNVIYDCDKYAFYIHDGIDADNKLNLTIQNNILDGNTADWSVQTHVLITGGYNCCMNDGSVSVGANSTYNGAANDLYATDPHMIDPANGDFRLLMASPCINAGTAVGFLIDYLGLMIRHTPDIGAHENQSNAIF